MNPFWVIFIDGHIGLRASKLKHNRCRYTPSHRATAGVPQWGSAIECTALHRVHFHHRRIETFGGQIFPGLSRLCGSNAAFTFAVLQKVPHRKTPGCIQRENLAVLAPQQTTVFRSQRHYVIEICFIKISC